MQRCANPETTRLHGGGATARGAVLLLLVALVLRCVAIGWSAPVSDPDGVAISPAGLGMERAFDANASTWSTLRTMHAFVLWFDEAVIGSDTH